MSSSVSVFISYAREDMEIALSLYDFLASIGIQPWMDKKSLMAGEVWESAIAQAVRSCDFFLFCASPRSVNKRGMIQRELRLAMQQWQSKLEDDIYLLPVRLEPCELPDSIASFQWLDFGEADFKERLLRSITEGIRRVGVAAPALPVSLNDRKIRTRIENAVSIDVSFPEFSPANSPGIAQMNALLSVFANRAASRFQASFSKVDPDFAEFDRRPYDLYISYQLALLTSEVISLEVYQYLDTGGAHGNSATHTFNVIRSPWLELEFETFAQSGQEENFVKTVSEYCTAALLRELAQEDDSYNTDPDTDSYRVNWIKTGAGPDVKNFSSTSLVPGGIKVIFDPYAVSSYAEGQREIVVPLNLIRALIRPEISTAIETAPPNPSSA